MKGVLYQITTDPESCIEDVGGVEVRTNELSELWFPAEAIHGNRLVLPDASCTRSLTLPQVLVLLNLIGNNLSSRVWNLVPDVSSLEISTVRWLTDCYAQVGYMDTRSSATHDFFVLRGFLYGDGTKLLPYVDGSGSKIKIRTGAYEARELVRILESFYMTDSWSGWMGHKAFLWVLAPLINPIGDRFLWLKDGISKSLVRNTMANLERKQNG